MGQKIEMEIYCRWVSREAFFPDGVIEMHLGRHVSARQFMRGKQGVKLCALHALLCM